MSLRKNYKLPSIPTFSLKIEYAESYGAPDSNLASRRLPEEWAFFVIKEAATPFLIGNTVYRISEGDTLMLPPFECLLPLRRDCVFRYYRILLPKDFLNRVCPLLLSRADSRQNRLLGEEKKGELFALCEKLLCGEESCEYTLFSLLHLLSQTNGAYSEKDEDTEAYERCLPISLKKVMLYVKNHYKSPLTAQALAKENGVSTAMLSALFSKHLGLSPKEYLTWIRMQAASELLLCKDSVEAVAHTLAYRDRSRFSRDFKAAFGVTPSAYLQNGGCVQNQFL